MRVSATKLRQKLYNILDEVLAKGIPVEIERKGEILKIVPEKPKKKLDNLESHNTIIGDPKSIIDIDWQSSWQEEEKL